MLDLPKCAFDRRSTLIKQNNIHAVHVARPAVHDGEAVEMVSVRAFILLGLPIIFSGCHRHQETRSGQGAESVDRHQRIGLPEFRSGQLSNFQRFDVDQDNIVDYADLPKKVSKRFSKMDMNQDSRVTIAEFEAASLRRFNGADANHDGWLDGSEAN